MNSKNQEVNLTQIVRKNKKRVSVLTLLGFALTVLGVLSTLFFNFHLQKENSTIEDTLTSKTSIVDSLTKKVDNDNLRHNTILAIIHDFLKIKEDTINISRFYSDTLERYYLMKNITIDQVKKERRKYNLTHKPLEIKFDPADIQLDMSNSDTLQAFVNATYYSGSKKDLIYHLKFNKKNKIFFIRNLQPKQQ